MDPEKIMDSLTNELASAMRAMSKAKTMEEKVAYSQIVRNMSESLGVFLSLAAEAMPFEEADDY